MNNPDINFTGTEFFQNKEFVISQDLFPAVPVLYAPVKDGVIVSHTYEELFRTKIINKKWRKEAMIDFLSTGTVVFPEGKTFFENVFEVPPGHDLYISGNNAFIKLRETLPKPSQELGEEAVPLLREELIKSLGDIPKDSGLCLSGGLDSGSVAAAWSTFKKPACFIYAASETPDLELAIETAKALKTEPYLLNPEPEVMLSELETMLKVLEIPVHIPLGPLPQFRLLKAMIKEGITTVYSGQGGDELFCGYPWHFPFAMRELALKDPETAEEYEIKHQQSPPFPILDLRLARRCFTKTESWVNLNCGGACEVLGITRQEAAERPGVKFFAPECSSWEEVRNQGLMNRSLRYLLHYDHRLADYFGMEGRAPFLTRPMAELVSKLKFEFLYSGGMLKYPLRKLFSEIPKKVRFHTKKTGFWHNGPGIPNLLPKVLQIIDNTELGNFVKAPEKIEKLSTTALWRFYSAGVLFVK